MYQDYQYASSERIGKCDNPFIQAGSFCQWLVIGTSKAKPKYPGKRIYKGK
jgi:hypothetical protein